MMKKLGEQILFYGLCLSLITMLIVSEEQVRNVMFAACLLVLFLFIYTPFFLRQLEKLKKGHNGEIPTHSDLHTTSIPISTHGHPQHLEYKEQETVKKSFH